METLQDELIAVKLREAEANLALKDLRQTVNELEGHWQVRKLNILGVQANFETFQRRGTWEHVE